MSDRQVIPFTTEDAWLRERSLDVTSTDAAALCGVSRWKSRYKLWQIKHRGAPDDVEETESMRLGKRLEPAIAAHIAAEQGFDIEPMKEYRRMPDVRLGSSFDFVLRDRSALLEIKLVGPMQFARGWQETAFGLEAPVEIEAQIQQEMLLAEIPVAFIGVLVGTETHLLRREFAQDVADRLQREARAFWTSSEPEPELPADAAFIARLYAQATPGKVIDADDEITELLAAYNEAATTRRIAEDAQDAAKARLLLKIGDAERVQSDIGTLSCGMVAAKEISYVRGEYRSFRFNPRRNK